MSESEVRPGQTDQPTVEKLYSLTTNELVQMLSKGEISLKELEMVLNEKDRQIYLLQEERNALQASTFKAELVEHSVNRRGFNRLMENILPLVNRNKQPISLLYLDGDSFKLINDTLGHKAGDKLLQLIDYCLYLSLKRGSDFCARLGGEEFAMVLPDTDELGALVVARRLAEIYEQAQNDIHHKRDIGNAKLQNEFPELSQFQTLSIGITTTIPGSLVTTDQLIAQGDAAMYRAKQIRKLEERLTAHNLYKRERPDSKIALFREDQPIVINPHPFINQPYKTSP